MDKKNLFNRMNDLDMDNPDVVSQVADDFIEWCWWNKTFPDIEVVETEKFKTIFVVHNLFDNLLKCEDSWEFLSDIKYLLNEYANHSEEDYKYVVSFWATKLNGLLN